MSCRYVMRTAGATCLCVRWKEQDRGRGQGRKGGEGGERERVGRGKRFAVGVHTYLKSKAKGKYEYGDLRREARRRPARSDKIAALQRARARVHASCMERSPSAPTTADFMKAGWTAGGSSPLLEWNSVLKIKCYRNT